MQIAIVHILTGNVSRKLLVNPDEKLSCGPQRGGITSIDSPKIFLSVETDWLYSNSRVIGIEIEGNNRGYPLSISNWHEIANDTISGVPVSITIYQHCGT